MYSSQKKFKLLLCAIAGALIFSGCANKSSKAVSIAPPIKADHSIGKFCERSSSDKLAGGRMYIEQGGASQFIDSCKHVHVHESDTVFIYIGGQAADDLTGELDEYLNPNDYYSEQEIAELDCLPNSQCDLKRIEAARMRGQLMRGAIIQFDTGSSEPKDQSVLNQMAAVASAEKLPVVVIGHTDAVGTDEFNLALSMRRAERVKELLAAHGVASNQIQVVGNGKQFPIADNQTSEGRALNRRATIKGEDHVINDH
ncbi:MAG: OmpA family protein [Sideroxydans sp.]|nr:OmpA family protein [Sideroxydans sp.]MDD5056629.1 OmpA family protein [Sideroxydans sp.]